MQGMKDQEFDAFFRQAAEQHRVPFNPNAWKKMRQKLERPSGESGSSAKKLLGLVLLLMLSGALGTAFWYQTSKSAPETTKSEALITNHTISKETPLPPAPEEATQPNPANQPKEAASEETYKQSNVPTGQQDQSASSQFLYELPQNTANSWMQAEGVAYVERNGVQPRVGKLHYPSVLPLEVEQEATDEVLPPLTERVRPLRWRISLGVSPDISAINLGEVSQVGSKFAIGLEYFVLPRLSIQTGVVFSNKLYTASGEAYRPYPGYWKKYPMPNTIDAQCDVLDIPINIRYYALNLPQSRVFISGGLSSYLMLTEDYVYQYRGGRGHKSRSYKHRERNKNRHYFRVANLSVGYERALSKRWALQVEPFVKIPVAGVGFGNIKLSTTGVFVALNYRLR